MKSIYFFLSFILFTSCKQSNQNGQEIERLRVDLQKATFTLDSLTKSKGPLSASLVHIVFISLKSPEDQAALNVVISEIRKLGEIAQVKNLQIGTFHDLQDPRSLSEYEVFFQMGFEDEDSYQAYQVDPIHLDLKNVLGEYLDGPPVTYDYEVD